MDYSTIPVLRKDSARHLLTSCILPYSASIMDIRKYGSVLLFPLALLVVFGIGAFPNTSNAANQQKTSPVFTIKIKQNGHLKSARNHIVKLERKPFELIVTFNSRRIPYVSLNTSFREELYTAAKDGEDLSKFQVFESGRGVAELSLNEDKDLIVNDEGNLSLHYANSKVHSFDDVKLLSNGSIVGRKKINFITKLTYTDSDNIFEKIPVNKIDVKHIYLVFLSQKWNKDFTKSTELNRDFIEITFQP